MTEKRFEVTDKIRNAASAVGNHLVVTISRQFGSGGSIIGRRLAEKMGIPFYDKEVNELTAEISGYAEHVVAMEENSTPMPAGLYLNGHYLPISHQIFMAQSESIERLAAKGSCVIIGRCAEYVLRNKAQLINVFVYADREIRIARIMKDYHFSREKAIQMLDEYDHARSEYHDYFTKIQWGKMEYYDIALNSGHGIDACVDSLSAFVDSIRKSEAQK